MPRQKPLQSVFENKLRAGMRDAKGLELLKWCTLYAKWRSIQAGLPETGAGSGFLEDDKDDDEKGESDDGGAE